MAAKRSASPNDFASCRMPANVLAGILQLAKSFGLALLFAAMGHCDVEDFHPRLAHETQGEPADDAFIIRVRGKQKRRGRIRSQFKSRSVCESSQRIGFAFENQAGVVG